jgi:hypothetical protein
MPRTALIEGLVGFSVAEFSHAKCCWIHDSSQHSLNIKTERYLHRCKALRERDPTFIDQVFTFELPRPVTESCRKGSPSHGSHNFHCRPGWRRTKDDQRKSSQESLMVCKGFPASGSMEHSLRSSSINSR